MNLNKEEIDFIIECIDLYWEYYNRHHEDNRKNKIISDNLVKKLTLTNVSQRYTIEDIERCVEHWGLCKVEKEYIEKFLNGG